MDLIGNVWRRTPGDFKAAAIALLVGSFLNPQFNTQSTVNGVITECSYFGLGEIVGGGLAVFLGVRLAVRSFSTDDEPRHLPARVALGLGALAALAGLVLVLKGFGLIWSPCP